MSGDRDHYAFDGFCRDEVAAIHSIRKGLANDRVSVHDVASQYNLPPSQALAYVCAASASVRETPRSRLDYFRVPRS
ncbi:MAG: hypothetical protein AABY05_00375 [Nanoarchaeota archaeon]